jgi:hypothetical protein
VYGHDSDLVATSVAEFVEIFVLQTSIMFGYALLASGHASESDLDEGECQETPGLKSRRPFLIPSLITATSLWLPTSKCLYGTIYNLTSRQ